MKEGKAMIFEIKAQDDGLEVGTYRAKFKGIEKKERADGTEMLVWRFEESKTKRDLLGFTDANTTPTTKNKIGRWLAGLTEQPPMAGVQVDPSNHIDSEYICIVALKQDGQGTKLDTFSVIPD